MKIGFFDSGIGGENILEAVTKALPQYEYTYFGDTFNVPYGDKSESEIYELTKNGVEWLFEHDAILVVIACNTASSETVRRLQDEFLPQAYPNRRILGVIIPTTEELIDLKSKKVLLVGTKRTIESKKYFLELQKRNLTEEIKLVTKATPKLVPYIESGDLTSAYEEIDAVLESTAREVDTLILGCTHYTVLKEHIRNMYPNLKVVSQDEIIPKKLKEYLGRHTEIESRLGKSGTKEIFYTGK